TLTKTNADNGCSVCWQSLTMRRPAPILETVYEAVGVYRQGGLRLHSRSGQGAEQDKKPLTWTIKREHG
ncbi:MAG: hypothetical protein WCS42_22385, partial [Verrucomicrobiota bacterium]